jgi:hypothetical protein
MSMTPLENMAKVRHDTCVRRIDPKLPGLWDALSAKGQADAVNDMRAAILALAEAELPHRMEDDRGGTVYPHEQDGMYRDVFRIMLRAIAEDRP